MPDRSAAQIRSVDQYSITSFPFYGALVVPDDDTDFAQPGFVRADSPGAVVFLPYSNPDGQTLTVNLVAGEYIPCLVRRVLATGTDAAVLHRFY